MSLFVFSRSVAKWIEWQTLIHISLIEKFQWSKIIIINDNDDKEGITNEIIAKQFSINLKPVAISSFKKTLSFSLDNFNTVLMLTKNNANPNATLENSSGFQELLISPSIDNKMESQFHPTNWVFISQCVTLHFNPFFISHDIKIYLIEAQLSEKDWHMYRLYFATGNKLIKKHVGNTKLKTLQLKMSDQPFPQLMGKLIRLTAILKLPVYAVTQPKQNEGAKRKGYNNEIVAILKRAINFTFIVEEPPDRLYGGVYRNNTPFGMLAKLHKNESDIGIALAHTTERARIVDFAPTLDEILGKIIYRHLTRVDGKIFFYLEPFTTVIWTCVICFVILIAVLLTINKYISQKNITKKTNKPKFWLLFDFALFKRFIHIFQLISGVSVINSNLSSNIILQIFHLFSILIFTHYSSKLTSILTVSKTHIPFESLEELVFQTDYSICTWKGSTEDELLRTAKVPSFRSAWEKIQSNPDKSFVKSREIGLQLVYTSKTAYLTSLTLGLIDMKGNCSYRFAKISFYKFNVAYVYRKEFIYKQMFSKYILSIKESGTLQKITRDNLPAPHNEACQDENEVVALKLSIILGLFLALPSGISISFLVLTIEICIQKYLV
uniref:Ionotropic glutamate receptor L-glutamate and glycine-binding domain-containing protein n=1 Tax=Strigamia maritima TaxID=126957 RepID=T1JP31_STRMM